jgi:hypothetical protein
MFIDFLIIKYMRFLAKSQSREEDSLLVKTVLHLVLCAFAS